MATYTKKGKKHCVVYDDPNLNKQEANGKKKRNQVWKYFDTAKEAKKFKAEVEFKISNKQYIPDSKETVREFFDRMIEQYASPNWKPTTVDGTVSDVRNHILPEIGNMKMQDVTPYTIEYLMNKLRNKKKQVGKNFDKSKGIPTISRSTLRHQYEHLSVIFGKAVEWKVITYSPVTCKKPERIKSDRIAWTKGQILRALDIIEDEQLHLAVHTSFFCTTRNGETMAIHWSDIDWNDGQYGSISINKTQSRVTLSACNRMKKEDLLFVYPTIKDDAKTRLILTPPKTQKSIRKVFLSARLREELEERKRTVDYFKAALGDKYYDYDLVFCEQDGTPREVKRNQRLFKSWQLQNEDAGLPLICFHELRHSSITYMLYVSGGERKDLLSVMSTAGHNNLETTMEYLHDNIEDRKRLAACAARDLWEQGDGEILSDTVLDITELNSANIVWNFFKTATNNEELLSPAAFVNESDYLRYAVQLLTGKSKVEYSAAV